MVDKSKFPKTIKSNFSRSKKGGVVCSCKTAQAGEFAGTNILTSGSCKCTLTSGKNFDVDQIGNKSGFRGKKLGGVNSILITAEKVKIPEGRKGFKK